MSAKEKTKTIHRMSSGEKQLSNPFSTGGGGPLFEVQVQAFFIALMLAGGCAPCLPCGPINKIKLQGKYAGYQTDDLIVFVQDPSGKGQRKLLGQVKHSISITSNDDTFADVIQAAWNDFKNPQVFTKGKDVIALITGPLSAKDTSAARRILEWAREMENTTEFFQNVERARFSSEAKREKLQVFKDNLKKANGGNDVPDEDVFEFLRHFHLLGYDLDIKSGVTLALLHSLIGQYSPDDAEDIWARLVLVVHSADPNAGTISPRTIPEDVKSVFKQRKVEVIPAELAIPHTPKPPRVGNDQTQMTALTIAALLGQWNESSDSDLEIIKRLVDGF